MPHDATHDWADWRRDLHALSETLGTDEDVAQAIGVTARSVQNWLRGRNVPRPPMRERIAEAAERLRLVPSYADNRAALLEKRTRDFTEQALIVAHQSVDGVLSCDTIEQAHAYAARCRPIIGAFTERVLAASVALLALLCAIPAPAQTSAELLSDARTTGVHYDSLDVWHPVFLQTQAAELAEAASALAAARDSARQAAADLARAETDLEAARLALALAQAQAPDTVYINTGGGTADSLAAEVERLTALVAWRDLQLNAANSRTEAANRNNERLSSLLTTTRETLTAERDAAVARAEAAERDAESGGDPARALALETALSAARDSLREAQEERGTLYDDLLLTRQLAERLRTRLEAEAAARAGERTERDAARAELAAATAALDSARSDLDSTRATLAEERETSAARAREAAAVTASLREALGALEARVVAALAALQDSQP